MLTHTSAEPDPTDNFRALDERTLLFAYDGSKPARASILEAAHRLGTDRCAIVLTVSHPGLVDVAATRIAYEGARLARSIGFDARPIAATGDAVWRGIVDAADAHDANILVLGSGEPAGGVARAVARHTTRPLLVNDWQERMWIRRAFSRVLPGWRKLTTCFSQRQHTVTSRLHRRSLKPGTVRSALSIVWHGRHHPRRGH